MIQKLKEWVNRVADIKTAEAIKKHLTVEDIEALEGLCKFSLSAIESEGKWPSKVNELDYGNGPSEAAAINRTIDACLSAHALEKAQWMEKLLTEEELQIIIHKVFRDYDLFLLFEEEAVAKAVHAAQQMKCKVVGDVTMYYEPIRGNFSARTILAGTRYEKLSDKKKDLADKLLELLEDDNV